MRAFFIYLSSNVITMLWIVSTSLARIRTFLTLFQTHWPSVCKETSVCLISSCLAQSQEMISSFRQLGVSVSLRKTKKAPDFVNRLAITAAVTTTTASTPPPPLTPLSWRTYIFVCCPPPESYTHVGRSTSAVRRPWIFATTGINLTLINSKHAQALGNICV